MQIIKKYLIRFWNSVFFRIILILIIVYLLLLDAWGLSVVNVQVNPNVFGTVGDWFSNVVSIATVLFALATIINDRRQSEINRQNDEKLHNKAQREHNAEILKLKTAKSKLVFVWTNRIYDNVAKRYTKSYEAVIVNRTDAPVFEWTIFDGDGNTITSHQQRGPLFFEDIRFPIDKEFNCDKISIEFKSCLGRKYSRCMDKISEVNQYGAS